MRQTVLMILVLLLTTASIRAESQTFIKQVPDNATMEYRIGGNLVQSITLPAGVYKITVEEMLIKTTPQFRKHRK